MVSSAEAISLFVLLMLSAFFSGSEVALVSLDRARLQKLISGRKRGIRYVQKLKSNPERMLSTILLGNNLVNVAASALTTAIMVRAFDSYAIGIATGVMTFLILVFGEIAPKTLSMAYDEAVACLVAPLIWYMSRVLSPILYLLEKLVGVISKIIKADSSQKQVTEEDVLSIVHIAQKDGALKPAEHHLIRKILEFDDKEVEQVLTPRKRMIVLPYHATVSDALKLFDKEKLSRIPIYKKNRDSIVGVVYAKTLLSYIGKLETPVTKVMQKPFFVPEKANLSTVLKQLQHRREQLAMVVDEHGSVVGLVTIEDLLEEVVGEIYDETDARPKTIRKIKRGVWEIDGQTEIAEVNSVLNTRLKHDDVMTLSGFILAHFKRIPNVGEQFTVGKVRIIVQETGTSRVRKVRVEKK